MNPHRLLLAVWLITGGTSVCLGEEPITGQALVRASAAALEFTGGGEVTETEVGDEDALYEVEVTFPGGRQVDVHLDADFNVVGVESDDESEDAEEDFDDDD